MSRHRSILPTARASRALAYKEVWDRSRNLRLNIFRSRLAAAPGNRAPRIQEKLRCGSGSRQDHETRAVLILHAGNQQRVRFHMVARIRAELCQQLERV